MISIKFRCVYPEMMKRSLNFQNRQVLQRNALKLPLLPTTTIGSYPQTKDVREARAKFKNGELSLKQYENFLKEKTIEAMKWQNEIGIDVPVHGEFERNDMVEYFGEKLKGFAFTENAWVQSDNAPALRVASRLLAVPRTAIC